MIRIVSLFVPSLWIILALCAFDVNSQEVAPLRRYAYARNAMGSEFNLVFYAPSDSLAKVASDSAFARIQLLNNLLSDYLDGSEVNRLSETAGTGQRFYASAILFDILEKSKSLSAKTNGAFDVTVGPIVQLWRRAIRRNYFPDKSQLKEARDAVGYRFVRLRAEDRSVVLKRKKMRIDFGAIGKGYAADDVLKVLKSFGIDRAFLDAGGDLAIGDAPPEKEGWRIEVSSGGGDTTATHILTLKNCGVATSGSTYRHFDYKGVRYSHIVSPYTGVGLTTHTRTTVITQNGTDADALATAFSVLGIKKSQKVAKRLKGVEVWLLEQNASKKAHYKY
ncbi:FAD:protein FMN transferase [Runella limosa]|uniref:FAD:protein FMN transferase n=1 Tax=Runella limosa TaxID=370978 RepID=UPI0003FD436F|nr:FAD:protein FMN transferase [Runella limosa]